MVAKLDGRKVLNNKTKPLAGFLPNVTEMIIDRFLLYKEYPGFGIVMACNVLFRSKDWQHNYSGTDQLISTKLHRICQMYV